METKEFDLLNKPWICVVRPDLSEDIVSLKDVFLHAHEYADLSGELPAQDIAMLRFLLAVLHAVFSRVDETGEDAPLEEAEDAYQRWKSLWDLGRFPAEPILDYLERWRERFWLFHPTRPFWQVPEAERAKLYSAAKLNGELMESANKLRLFPSRVGGEKDRLTFAEAARWLLYVNGFDDTALKKSPQEKEWEKRAGQKLPSAGAGWLGKLGLISAQGETLFETLLLNLVLLDENEEPWESSVPTWEREAAGPGIREEISCPRDQADLLSLQSRRLLLYREGDTVTGFFPIAGEFFEKEKASCEQMTLWRPVYQKKDIIGQQPRRHDNSRKMWQDFSSIAVRKGGGTAPGVVNWTASLRINDCLPERPYSRYRITCVQYGDKDFFVTDSFEDSLTFHTDLLTDMGERWVHAVEDEVGGCDTLAGLLSGLAGDLDLAAGGDGKAAGVSAKEQFFYRVDVPFRNWLRSLDPAQGDTARESLVQEWRKEARRIAYQLGEELVRQAGPAAFRGRLVKKNEKDKGYFYAAPKAYNVFQARLGKWYVG